MLDWWWISCRTNALREASNPLLTRFLAPPVNCSQYGGQVGAIVTYRYIKFTGCTCSVMETTSGKDGVGEVSGNCATLKSCFQFMNEFDVWWIHVTDSMEQEIYCGDVWSSDCSDYKRYCGAEYVIWSNLLRCCSECEERKFLREACQFLPDATALRPRRKYSSDIFMYIPRIFIVYYLFQQIYTGCPRRNMPDFGRVFLMFNYNDITQNTYVQSWTVTEIMAREKCGLLAGPRTVPVSWQLYLCYVVQCGTMWREFSSR